jgi:hypothetical protein
MNNKIHYIKAILFTSLFLIFLNSNAQVKKIDPHSFGNINTKYEPSLEEVNAFFPDSVIESKKA